MNWLLRKAKEEAITKIKTGMNKSISQGYSSSFKDKGTDTSEITELKEAWFNREWDVFIKGHIGLKNYTKVFRRVSGRNNIRDKVNSIYKRIYITWIQQKIFSFIIGLTDNLFDVIHKNTSLIQDSIAERTNEVSSGKMINKFACHLHRNDSEYQDGWILQRRVE